MHQSLKISWFCALMLSLTIVCAQRTYKSSSVLATGNWFKVAVSGEGVYKMDASFLNSLGIGTNIPSAQVRLFGNGGGMLAESNSIGRFDDLEENAIMVVDGGDGILNGSDYILFFARGPHHWVTDSLNRKFSHLKNIYSDKAYYFITVSGTGKRISIQPSNLTSSINVTSFDERYFHEIDSFNLLGSGKEWVGEEFGNSPGQFVTRTFTLPAADNLVNQPATIVSNVLNRSINSVSRFNVQVNNQLVQQIGIPAVSGSSLDLIAQQVQQTNTFTLTQPHIKLDYNYAPGSFNAQGWLNWFEVFYRRNLSLPPNQQLLFRDWNSVGTSSAAFILSNADASTQVWDVTNALEPKRLSTTLSGNQLHFINDAQTLHEYVAFSSTFLIPQAAGRVPNQNLHNTSLADYIIVTSPDFQPQAERLAQFHQQHNKLKTTVATTDQIFNEFSSGIPDPTAIRDFVKMYYDKYRSTWTESGKYLLLFGKGSYDFKNRLNSNKNHVPVYESASSFDPLSTYTSDDFFAFLDDNEDVNSTVIINQLDVGVGRIPAKTVDDAKNFVDKVLAYHSPAAFGPWRNNLNFIADDEDYNLHLQDAEVITATSHNTAPVFNQKKIYLDAFRQEGSPAGGRYPQANEMINNQILNGTLIWNYTGHGSPPRLADETVVDQQIINSWNNANRLPLFITASCNFGRYDNPVSSSAGENLVVRPKTGAIAMMSTTRLVFAFSNRVINNNYLQFALQPDANGRYRTLGEAMQISKNHTYQTFGDIVNNRKFGLLGDPAMTLAFPTLKVKPTTINGKGIGAQMDTLSATEFVTIDGEVADNSGNILQDFIGTVYLTLFDKPQSVTTLGNDPTSIPATFQTQARALFNGKVSATAGKFSFKFKMPKDINYQFGNGKISLYAQDGKKDGNGFSTSAIIGGIASSGNTDNEGPIIKAYLNNESFVNGSITNENAILVVKLSDSSGINTGGSGIGHDIVAIIDEDNQSGGQAGKNYILLNDFYESELDSYQQGTIRFQLPQLTAGHHTLKIKAWDVMNNSSEYILEFTVINDDQLKLDHVLNYPNPFSTKTAFWFEHNKPSSDLKVKIEIFTVAGRLVKTINQTINNPGNRSNDIEWDGRDEFGAKVGRGVYLYRLHVISADGKKASHIQRLVVLR